MKKYIGIDIGGSFIKYGLLDETGTILQKKKRPTDRNDPKQVLTQLATIISEESNGQTIAGVGISLPGIIDPDEHLLTSGALTDLYQYDVQQILTEKTGQKIKLVNDANAIGYAEGALGAGSGCDNFVCLPLGTGVGGSVVLNGKLRQGRTGAAGEFGMMLMGLGKTEPVGYESASFYCGAVGGLCRIYNQKLGRRDLKTWNTDVKAILAAAENGDELARQSVAEFYQNVAVLLLNISVALDPEQILIGGGISENAEIMSGIKEACQRLLARYADMSVIGLPDIISCQLGNDAGMIGAVLQFIEGEDER